jgi:cobalt/nickel transport system permease protein
MTSAFNPLLSAPSPLQRLDPRWKLAGLLWAAAVVSALGTLAATGVAFLGALALAWVGRLPLRWYLARLAPVLLFLLLFTFPLPFLLEDTGPTWSIGQVQVSAHGLFLAGLVCGKALTILTLMLVLLTSSPLEANLKAAHALYLPGLLVQLAFLTYRYIFLLLGEWGRLRVALRVRGFRSRVDRHSYRTLGHVAGTLLVRGYERAERVGQAMRCRGFTGRFYSLAEFRSGPVDVGVFLVVVVCSTLLLAWDLCR